MKIQEQPDYLIFADEAKVGEVMDFPNVARGWGVTIDQTQSKPPMEWMNGAFNRIDKNMLYLLQQGIPEWNNSVLYPVGAVIKYKNKIYIAKIENDNAIPSTNTTKWDSLVKDVQDASTTQKGIVKLNSSTNSDSETEAATPKAVKEVAEKANNALSKESGGEVKGDTNFTGKLQQNGIDVLMKSDMKSYVIESYVSDDKKNWYRKYSDGWVEQGGLFYFLAAPTTLNLLIAAKIMHFSLTINAVGADPSSSSCQWTQSNNSNITVYRGWTYANNVSWYSCGYVV